MKKMILLLLIILPCVVKAETCSKEEIDELRAKAHRVEFNIEYIKSDDIDYSDVYFSISSSNLEEDFFVTFQGEPHTAYIITNDSSTLLKGGVYNVEFVSTKCDEQVVYSYNMMIPFFNEENKDVWFDGTYEDEIIEDSQNHTTEKGMSILFVVICAIAFILIVTISIILVKKRRKIK